MNSERKRRGFIYAIINFYLNINWVKLLVLSFEMKKRKSTSIDFIAKKKIKLCESSAHIYWRTTMYKNCEWYRTIKYFKHYQWNRIYLYGTNETNCSLNIDIKDCWNSKMLILLRGWRQTWINLNYKDDWIVSYGTNGHFGADYSA